MRPGLIARRRFLASAFAFALASAFPATDLVAQSAPAVEHSVKVHAGLYEIVTSDLDGSVWVAGIGSDASPGARLVALDPTTLAERRVIEVDDAAAFGIGINNQTHTLYTSNTRAGNMSAVDLQTGEVTLIEDPDADGSPHLYRVVVDEQRNKVYSSVASSDGSIWVVDGSTNRLEKTIPTSPRPTGLVLDVEANRLYAASQTDNVVDVIDPVAGRILNRIPTHGARSTQLAFDPATKRIFVGNQGTNNITVIDAEAGEVIRTVPAGEQPVGVAYHPGVDRIYVAARAGGVVTVLDGTTYEQIAQLEIGTYPNTIHVDEDTGRVYVTNKAARGETPDPNGDKVTLLRP